MPGYISKDIMTDPTEHLSSARLDLWLLETEARTRRYHRERLLLLERRDSTASLSSHDLRKGKYPSRGASGRYVCSCSICNNPLSDEASTIAIISPRSHLPLHVKPIAPAVTLQPSENICLSPILGSIDMSRLSPSDILTAVERYPRPLCARASQAMSSSATTSSSINQPAEDIQGPSSPTPSSARCRPRWKSST
jgi:hypothetical protein